MFQLRSIYIHVLDVNEACMFMSVDEPPYRNVWLKFDPKRLKLFLPLPPYSQTQFIVLFFSNLCYLVKEGWEVRGPDRGYVYPVAGATRPLLGDGCVIQCV